MRHLVLLLALTACTDAAKDDDHEHTDEGEETDSPADTDDTDDSEPPIDDYEVLATATDGVVAVRLLAKSTLIVGYNEIWFEIVGDEGAPITDATVTQMPVMDMGDHSHACPYTQPVLQEDGLFRAEIVPIMGSEMMGTWSMEVMVHDNGAGTDHAVTLDDLEVVEMGWKKDLEVGEDRWIITLTPLADLEVGEIPVAVTAHRMADMMSFPPVEDLTLTIEPTMPSMGHGSEGNVDPTYRENGRYEGVMGFSMGGEWEVEIGVSQGGAALGSVVFTFDI